MHRRKHRKRALPSRRRLSGVLRLLCASLARNDEASVVHTDTAHDLCLVSARFNSFRSARVIGRSIDLLQLIFFLNATRNAKGSFDNKFKGL